jgi:hypothetical protein
MSPTGNSAPSVKVTGLIWKEFRCRETATFAAAGAARGLVLGRLEQLGVELMTLQQFVEFGAVTFGESSRLRHIAVGNFEQLRKIITLEFLACVLERGKFTLLVLYCLLYP